MKPLYSVIIPTYNRGYMLWKAIQSVQKQRYPFWELVIVDDGSTDTTKSVVAQFQDDMRIRMVTIKHSGVARARNTGLQHAHGDYIAYLDSDDSFYENLLSTVSEMFAKQQDKVFAISNYNFRIELYDTFGKLQDFTRMEQRQPDKLHLQDIYHWKVKSAFGTGLVHKRSALKAGIAWDEKLTYLEDWDFVMQLGNHFPEGFLHIPMVLYEYKQRFGADGNAALATYTDYATGFEAIYQKHKNDPLMKGQTWYPRLVSKYQALQKAFEQGKTVASVYKYFPHYDKQTAHKNNKRK